MSGDMQQVKPEFHADFMSSEEYKKKQIKIAIDQRILWKKQGDGRYIFVLPAQEYFSNFTDKKLLPELLKYCAANRIQADIIQPAAEMTPRFGFLQRQHSVTYHYKMRGGNLTESHYYDSRKNMDKVDFSLTGLASFFLSPIRWIYRAVTGKKNLLSVNQINNMQKEIQAALPQQEKISPIQPHYANLQPNDHDCAYWATLFTKQLANNPDATTAELFGKNEQERKHKSAKMEEMKEVAARRDVQQFGREYLKTVTNEGNPFDYENLDQLNNDTTGIKRYQVNTRKMSPGNTTGMIVALLAINSNLGPARFEDGNNQTEPDNNPNTATNDVFDAFVLPPSLTYSGAIATIRNENKGDLGCQENPVSNPQKIKND